MEYPSTIAIYAFVVVFIGESALFVKTRWGQQGEFVFGLGLVIVLMLYSHIFCLEHSFKGEKYIRVMASSALLNIPSIILLFIVNRLVTVVKMPIGRRALAWLLYLLVLFL